MFREQRTKCERYKQSPSQISLTMARSTSVFPRLKTRLTPNLPNFCYHLHCPSLHPLLHPLSPMSSSTSAPLSPRSPSSSVVCTSTFVYVISWLYCNVQCPLQPQNHKQVDEVPFSCSRSVGTLVKPSRPGEAS